MREGDLVGSVKNQIQEKTGVPVDYMDLFAVGKLLKDGDVLPQGELEVKLTLRGGRERMSKPKNPPGIDTPSDPVECFCTPGAVCCYCFQCRLEVVPSCLSCPNDCHWLFFRWFPAGSGDWA